MMAANDQPKPKNPSHEITCVLKLDTSAKGWHSTISKVVRKVEGVSYSIDIPNGTATIHGLVDPKTLMKRLRKSDKHAELIKVDSGTLRDSRIRKQKKALAKEEEEEEYLKQLYRGYNTAYYGYATNASSSSSYDGYGGGYPSYYGSTTGVGGYYGSQIHHHHQPYNNNNNNYYQDHHQPYNYPNNNYYYGGTNAVPNYPGVTYAPPQLGFPQPPPALDIHPFYDADTPWCTIM